MASRKSKTPKSPSTKERVAPAHKRFQEGVTIIREARARAKAAATEGDVAKTIQHMMTVAATGESVKLAFATIEPDSLARVGAEVMMGDVTTHQSELAALAALLHAAIVEKTKGAGA